MKFEFHNAEKGVVLANTHRGYCEIYPENTMPAFEGALRANTHCIEIDIQLTRDNQLVVVHDHVVDRVSTGTGFVDRLTYEELLAFDFGIKFGQEFKGTKIPLFVDVLSWAIKNGVGLIVEAKQRIRQDAFIDCFVNVIRAVPHAVNFIQLLSFDHVLINKVKKIIPELALQVVTLERYNNQLECVLGSNASCVCFEYEFAHIDDLRAYKQHGLGTRMYLHAHSNNKTPTENYYDKFGVEAEEEILAWIREGLIDMISHDDALYMISLINKANMKAY
ncbi:glycerophosphodiester phosphodiesterase family protein [Vibrio sp. M250220]|uniref:glycerophosphodiester phosphodiesterase n=1 Tax=Vibrio sp. M250220 TaxID=3020894 RepID=UPI002F41508B